MSASLRRRLARLMPAIRETGYIALANGWMRIGRGLFIPPRVSVEEWEATTRAQQADALAGVPQSDQTALHAELVALSKAADIAAQAQRKRQRRPIPARRDVAP